MRKEFVDGPEERVSLTMRIHTFVQQTILLSYTLRNIAGTDRAAKMIVHLSPPLLS